jgi:hypothetical protein
MNFHRYYVIDLWNASKLTWERRRDGFEFASKPEAEDYIKCYNLQCKWRILEITIKDLTV